MGTPFITLQEPTPLDGYLLGRPAEEQPASVPKTFTDAMEVRTAVFVQEQSVPAENEFDPDDPRSCHWVIYASVNQVEQDEILDERGNVVQPRRSSTRSTPIGTLRCVPFPHEPHPVDGGEYWNGQLTGLVDADGQRRETPTTRPVGAEPAASASVSASASASASAPSGGEATVGYPHDGPHHAADRATSLHDGKEPYVKLGRLAVTRDFRGHGLAKLLVGGALAWLRAHPTYFNPSVAELGLEGVGAATEKEIPEWKGLVCVHAQEQVVRAWERLGFAVDEGMGRWMEEGIWHRGMFLRLEVNAAEDKKVA